MNFNAVLAQAQPAPASQQAPPPWTQLIMFLPILVIGYFIMIRPQQKRAKDQAALLKAIKPGDKIVTSSGIIGVVITVKEKSVSIRSADSKLEITKTAVTEVVERSGESSES